MSASLLPPLLLPLLRRLADGKFHSGQKLAAEYGISRATVFNLIRQADGLGLKVHAVHGRGYRLADKISWLDAQDLQTQLGAAGQAFEIQLLDQVDSTNTNLFARAMAGAAHRTVLYADYQHAGRGRRGRSWQAPLGGGLAFSLLWRFEQGASRLSGLSIVVGLALTRALAQCCPDPEKRPVRIKWPNDVLAGYRKLAGILVEVQGEMDGPSFAVIGIGVNQRLPAAFREDIDQAVVDLEEIGANVSRATLMTAILRELAQAITDFEQSGMQRALQEWPYWHAHEGRQVVMRTPDGGRYSGVASGLDKAGNLLLKIPGGELRAFGAGEVSLRPLP